MISIIAYYFTFIEDKFNCRYEQVHLYNPNFILSSHDLCEQELFVVFGKLSEEVRVVLLEVGDIMKSVAVLCFCYV